MKRELASDEGKFMTRWSLLPQNKFFNIHLHRRFANDPNDMYLHDHPFWNISIVLKGGYVEIIKADKRKNTASWHNLRGIWHKPGSIIFRRPTDAHRILVGAPSWSIWITGPVCRRWGFYLPEGWVHWRKFVAMTRSKT